MSTASLPFYVLHQTVIIVIGYHVVRGETGVLTKFVVIAVSLFVATAAIYEVLVRRLVPLRFLFGMRPRG